MVIGLINKKQNLIEKANNLVARYNEYKSDMAMYVRKSNAELYKLLGSMMQMCLEIDAHKERNEVLRELRAKLKNERGIGTQVNSKTAAIVAKYVTGATRKTAHVYARVIDTAMAAGVKAEELVAFIENAGGIDKVRQQTAKAVAQKKERKEYFDGQIAFARKELRKRAALGVLQTQSGKRMNLRGYKGAEFTYAVCRKNAEGKLEVVATLAQDEKLEEYALRCFASNWELAEFERANDSNDFIDKCKEYGANSNVVQWWMEDNGIANSFEIKKMKKKLAEQEELQAA